MGDPNPVDSEGQPLTTTPASDGTETASATPVQAGSAPQAAPTSSPKQAKQTVLPITKPLPERTEAGSDGTEPAGDGRRNVSTRARIILAVWLLALTVPLICAGNSSMRHLESFSTFEHKEPWTAPSGVSLNVGPETFAYDGTQKALVHRGPVAEEGQQELRGLLQFGESEAGNGQSSISAQEQIAIRTAYAFAVDRLSFESRKYATQILLWLLIVGGIFGSAGSLARMHYNFLVIVCYQKGRDFDPRIWWPYYVLLPVLGFLLGVFVTVLLKANLMTIEDHSPAGNLWWAGISILVGFGAIDVAERLKDLVTALFGRGRGRSYDRDRGKGKSKDQTT